MERREVLGLCLEVDLVGPATPVTYLPGEDCGSSADTRVAATVQGPLGEQRRALEIAGMFGSSPGGVQPAGDRIVVFAQLGCALECSRGRYLAAALGEAGGGSFERRGD